MKIIYNWKIFVIIFLLSTLHFQPSTSQVSAQESSPASTVSADIKAKLKALQEEIASKANQLKVEMGKKLQNKVYLGSISSKGDNTFVLNTKKGDKKIEIKDYTDYLGDVDDKETLLAKRIIKTQALKVNDRQVVFGQIISADKKTLAIKDKKDQQITFSFDSKTKIKISGKNGTSKDLKAGQKITAVLIKGLGGIFKARFIYLFPDPATITPTPSQNPTSS